MKKQSGSASYGPAFKVAAVLICLFGLIAIWGGRSRMNVRSLESTDLNAQPADPGEAEAAPLQRRSGEARHDPVKVQPFHGQYCASVGPPGWAVIAENPQRAAFGADFASADGLAYASYSIFPAGSLAPPGFETPLRAVTASLTSFGTVPTRIGNPRQVAPNVFLLEYQSATNHGLAFYQVIPAGEGGYMIVMRLGGTGNSPGQWEKRASEAMAVARSLRCQVPMVPAGPDPPGLNSRTKSGNDESEDSDTHYNTWLEMEYYHNPQSGENYWVSPSSDYSRTGPDGPGYYATYGGDLIKLSPGYAQ